MMAGILKPGDMGWPNGQAPNPMQEADAYAASVASVFLRVGYVEMCGCADCVQKMLSAMSLGYQCEKCGYVGPPCPVPCTCDNKDGSCDLADGLNEGNANCRHGDMLCPVCGDDDVEDLDPRSLALAAISRDTAVYFQNRGVKLDVAVQDSGHQTH